MKSFNLYLGPAALLLIVCSIAWKQDKPATKPAKGEVDPQALMELIDRADRLVVFAEPAQDAVVLYETSERHDLDALKSALKLARPEKPVHCMCLGSPIIVLYAGDERVGEIRNHHAVLVRTDLWESDAPITDREAYLAWFDERKITAPRDEVNAERQRQEQFARDRRRWVEAAPASVQPLLPEVEKAFSPGMAVFKPSRPREGAAAAPARNPALEPLREALAGEFGDEADRVLALLAWFGSGAGQWSGFPSYEAIPEQMLLAYPTPELLAAIQGRDL